MANEEWARAQDSLPDCSASRPTRQGRWQQTRRRDLCAAPFAGTFAACAFVCLRNAQLFVPTSCCSSTSCQSHSSPPRCRCRRSRSVPRFYINSHVDQCLANAGGQHCGPAGGTSTWLPLPVPAKIVPSFASEKSLRQMLKKYSLPTDGKKKVVRAAGCRVLRGCERVCRCRQAEERHRTPCLGHGRAACVPICTYRSCWSGTAT